MINFILFNILNVIVQTIKSIATIKCSKTTAAIINAFAYALYTYVVILTMCELPLLFKCVAVGLCNFVGVYVVKFFEEKSRKGKLWRVEATLPHDEKEFETIHALLEEKQIPHNYIDINKYYLLNIYCATQKQSAAVKEVLSTYNAKYFVTESKVL
jgi:hypothetical protein